LASGKHSSSRVAGRDKEDSSTQGLLSKRHRELLKILSPSGYGNGQEGLIDLKYPPDGDWEDSESMD
jgi:hypothetical protein